MGIDISNQGQTLAVNKIRYKSRHNTIDKKIETNRQSNSCVIRYSEYVFRIGSGEGFHRSWMASHELSMLLLINLWRSCLHFILFLLTKNRL